ncbi:MAG: polyprenyl synthetase family protein [Acidobacteriota bacterium]
MNPGTLFRWAPLVDEALDRVLAPAGTEPRELHEAMRYSVFAGGKRLRPILALCAYSAAGGVETEAVLPAAAGLELLHTYSLIHDDLPSMDNDDLRRGKPTCHKVFGEATAILAGDALQTLGAYLLCAEPKGARWTARRNRVSRTVLGSLGSLGMAGGQVLDLRFTGAGAEADAKTLQTIHRLKTGAFLEACLMAGALWAGAPAAVRRALLRYGRAVGLAFQIVDDILDATESTESLGKTAGKDAAQGKATFPALWGLEASRRAAQDLLSEALRSVADLGPASQDLREIAHFVVNRSR